MILNYFDYDFMWL